MLRLLSTPRWISFTAVALLAILAFGALSYWQWNRAEEKRLENAIVTGHANEPARPVTTVADAPSEWEHVSVTGTYGTDQHLLRNRPLDGSQGFWVVTPLIADGSDAPAGSVTWVARGWVPQVTAATQSVTAPTAPDGTVTVSGYLRASAQDPTVPSDSFPNGQIAAINTTELTQALDTADEGTLPGSGASVAGLEDWYVQSEAADGTEEEMSTLPLPEADDSRNLSYAGQWLLFAAIAIGGWFYFLRREARETEPDPEGPKGLDEPRGTANTPGVDLTAERAATPQ